MSISRRQLLTGGAATAAGVAVSGILPSLTSGASAHGVSGNGVPSFPPHVGKSTGGQPFPPLNGDPNGILALPEGFSYKVVTTAEDLPNGVKRTSLAEGQGLTPSNHDGTAVVASGRNRVTLIQNHELGKGAAKGVPNVAGTVYDAKVTNGGGCTVITADANGTLISETVGISGTLSNCAGGPTPWGTWLTCEETEQKAGSGYDKDHGYVFEVFADGKADPTPLKALGRFAHEAVAIDADLQHIYLTEDAGSPTGLVFRWTAPRGVRVGSGLAKRGLQNADFGKLEALQVLLDDGSVLTDVAYITSAQLGRPFKTSWIEVPDRDAQTTSIRKQFTDGTVTRGKKFEGIWANEQGAYIVNSFAFASSDLPADATKHDGMVWFYNFKDETISLVTYFPHNEVEAAGAGAPAKFVDMTFDGPDNVSITPWGTLILAEDGANASHVLSSIPGGATYAIARNMLNDSEFTGPTFTPDGSTLFVNIQTPGITLAITGPWKKYLG